MNFHRPSAAVWPESTEQVSKIVRFATNTRSLLCPSAAQASAGERFPFKEESSSTLAHEQDRRISIETATPGCRRASLRRSQPGPGEARVYVSSRPCKQLRRYHRRNVNTNAGGIKGAKYGTTRDYVMASRSSSQRET